MTIKASTVLVDRLEHALGRNGVSMKRRALLETAAYAFAYRNSNEFTALCERENVAPPQVTVIGRVRLPDGRNLLVVDDTQAKIAYGIDETFVSTVVQDERRERIGVTPYGHLVRLDHMTSSTIPDIAVGNGKTDFTRSIDLLVSADGTLAKHATEYKDRTTVASARRSLESAIALLRSDDGAAAVHELRMVIDLLESGIFDDEDESIDNAREDVFMAIDAIADPGIAPRMEPHASDPEMTRIMAALLVEIDQEIESRKGGGDPEAWRILSGLSDMGHSAVRKSGCTAPEDVVTVSRDQLAKVLQAARVQHEDVTTGIENGIYDREGNEDLDVLGSAIRDLDLRLAMKALPKPQVRGMPEKGTMDVHTACITHDKGYELYVSATEKDLDAQMAEYCRDNWSEVENHRGVPNDPTGLDDREIATLFFEAHQKAESETHVDTAVRRIRIDGPTNASVTAVPSGRVASAEPRWITDQDGENTADISQALETGERLPYRRTDKGLQLLTEREEEHLLAGTTLNAHLDVPVRMGGSVLHGEAKWIAPLMEFPWDSGQEDFVDDGSTAWSRMERYMLHVGPMVTALGGRLHPVRSATETAHELVVMLPFELAFESATPDDWKDALSYLFLTEAEKKQRPTVSCEFIPEVAVGDNVMSVDPVGQTIWDATFDAMRWGTQYAMGVLTGENDPDDYAWSPLAPKWVRDWTNDHPFTVRPTGLVEALRIAI
jgi:hypothetical protein